MKTRTIQAKQLTGMIGSTVLVRMKIASVIDNARYGWVAVETDDGETYAWPENENVEIVDEVTGV